MYNKMGRGMCSEYQRKRRNLLPRIECKRRDAIREVQFGVERYSLGERVYESFIHTRLPCTFEGEEVHRICLSFPCPSLRFASLRFLSFSGQLVHSQKLSQFPRLWFESPSVPESIFPRSDGQLERIRPARLIERHGGRNSSFSPGFTFPAKGESCRVGNKL
ncbi:hypothetical protein Mp_1g01710 [Marchantia polymorpha subsp. ruderalis]|uniref:Uncharacterized protein n=2 Tax=Marchantia polymorpha TaxID=3197 RepID=A0AAF6AKG7_MARPO|nr:hypothetical protein MARPO_0029s0075 [Marchantia polymorpha]BBM96937.1 hypothetical protein Mp_1g01710 [Marchantia polymorpha subsp. ruderalis]|eukprot:PTQ42545.1 hypothetical protein MARPO_0029s0075 [Marchantia polymorpha]